MSVDWTGETVAWIVLAVSTLYLADRVVIWLVKRYSHRVKPENVDQPRGPNQ